jgi:hypothetical protein
VLALLKQLHVPTGEPIVDPEVDLSAFLARQRLKDQSISSFSQATIDEDDDIDPSLAQINPNSSNKVPSKKGKVQQIEWDASLEEMEHNKNVAKARSGKWYEMSLNTSKQLMSSIFQTWKSDYGPVPPARWERRQSENTPADRVRGCFFVFTTFFANELGFNRSVRSPKEAPPLPQDPTLPEKTPRADMEDFLDNLLNWQHPPSLFEMSTPIFYDVGLYWTFFVTNRRTIWSPHRLFEDHSTIDHFLVRYPAFFQKWERNIWY